VRIDKLLAHAGFGTRKQVRQLIKQKHVKINGEVVKNHGIHVDPNLDFVTVFDEKVIYSEFIYLMLNKPNNYITATFDNEHLTVLDLVPEEFLHFDLSPVGRLDKDTEGLLLLTNDGKINHILTSPKNNIWKTYEAIVDGHVTDKHVRQFNEGVTLDDGYKTKPASLTIISHSENESKIQLSITEGKFHQVKRMFQAIGMEVVYLKRTKIGEILLDEQLALGEVRPLLSEETDWIQSLKEGE
jgi:16S rRNA pseudouridine516 synthase